MAVLSKIPRTNVSVADIRDTLNPMAAVSRMYLAHFSRRLRISIFGQGKSLYIGKATRPTTTGRVMAITDSLPQEALHVTELRAYMMEILTDGRSISRRAALHRLTG